MSRMVDPGNQDVTESSFSLVPHALGVQTACPVWLPLGTVDCEANPEFNLRHCFVAAGAWREARAPAIHSELPLAPTLRPHFRGGKR
jgi:hypothetical protein